MNKLLIVDDEAELTTILKEELQKCNSYEIDIAFDGVEAINLIQKKLYDVVLLDFKMPRADGREVLKFIKENSSSSQTIMVSNFADLQLAVEMTKLGAYDVLGKPYDINQLEQIIERALEYKKLLAFNPSNQKIIETKQELGQFKFENHIILKDKEKIAFNIASSLISNPNLKLDLLLQNPGYIKKYILLYIEVFDEIENFGLKKPLSEIQNNEPIRLDELEKQHIIRVLKIYNGNRSKTSDALGISQKTLYTKIKDYGIDVE